MAGSEELTSEQRELERLQLSLRTRRGVPAAPCRRLAALWSGAPAKAGAPANPGGAGGSGGGVGVGRGAGEVRHRPGGAGGSGGAGGLVERRGGRAVLSLRGRLLANEVAHRRGGASKSSRRHCRWCIRPMSATYGAQLHHLCRLDAPIRHVTRHKPLENVLHGPQRGPGRLQRPAPPAGPGEHGLHHQNEQHGAGAGATQDGKRALTWPLGGVVSSAGVDTGGLPVGMALSEVGVTATVASVVAGAAGTRDLRLVDAGAGRPGWGLATDGATVVGGLVAGVGEVTGAAVAGGAVAGGVVAGGAVATGFVGAVLLGPVGRRVARARRRRPRPDRNDPRDRRTAAGGCHAGPANTKAATATSLNIPPVCPVDGLVSGHLQRQGRRRPARPNDRELVTSRGTGDHAQRPGPGDPAGQNGRRWGRPTRPAIPDPDLASVRGGVGRGEPDHTSSARGPTGRCWCRPPQNARS